MATKTKKHQNHNSDEEYLHSLINGENRVSAGVLTNASGNYARI